MRRHGVGWGSVSAFLLSARYALGKGLQQEHTHLTTFPTRRDDRNGPNLSEPWFSQERHRPSQGKLSDSSHRSPRNHMGGKSRANSIFGAWDQQAEKGTAVSDLSSKARQTQRPPWGSPSQRHHVPSRHLTPSFLLSTKG